MTGGASGIGQAIAAALRQRGCTVVIADTDGPAAERTAGRLGATAALADVTDATAVRTLVHRTRDHHGRLDYMVNNAGIGVAGRCQDLTLDHWNRLLQTNLHGVVHGVHAAYPVMLDQGHGHIVNIASLAGLTPAPFMLPYTTAKHALVGLSLALRAEAAPHGVKVTAVCPGFVDTPLLDNANPGLPPTAIGRDWRRIATRAQIGLHPADRLARTVLSGLERDKALIVTPALARLAWYGTRLAPATAVRVAALARHLLPAEERPAAGRNATAKRADAQAPSGYARPE
ncbi:SDR family NAD(P)-dependent oxidoreductase [Spirillospora sp. CA-253888]